MKFLIMKLEVFWVVTPYSFVKPLDLEIGGSMISYHNTTWLLKPEDPDLHVDLHGNQKSLFILQFPLISCYFLSQKKKKRKKIKW
jgi:hypothetical protein